MEKKPSTKKRLIMVGILILTLVAFFAGGVVLSSAHAASMGKKPGQPGTPGPANAAKTPELANGASGTVTKIDGSTITVQAEGQTFTIRVTGSTTFSKGQVDLQTHTKSSQPASFSDLAVGETIQAYGRLNSDGSLTASKVVIMPSDVGTPSDGGKK